MNNKINNCKRLIQSISNITKRQLAQTSVSCSDKVIDPADITLPNPNYHERSNESVELKKARLLYQSRKRGMLENGLLMSTFAAKHLDKMSKTEMEEYDKMINLPSNDWDIYYWAVGSKPTPPEFDTSIMRKFKHHVKNTKKEQRYSQPPL